MAKLTAETAEVLYFGLKYLRNNEVEIMGIGPDHFNLALRDLASEMVKAWAKETSERADDRTPNAAKLMRANCDRWAIRRMGRQP